MFQLPRGAVRINKRVPLSLVSGGVVLELELNSGAAARFNVGGGDGPIYSSYWDISDVSTHCNLRSIDSSLSNSHAKHVSSGNCINYHTKSTVATKRLITGSSFTISIARGYLRLRQVYSTFHKTGDKKILDFHHPVSGTTPLTDNDLRTLQLVIGSRRFPDRPTTMSASNASDCGKLREGFTANRTSRPSRRISRTRWRSWDGIWKKLGANTYRAAGSRRKLTTS
jgi:hypothetical protein